MKHKGKKIFAMFLVLAMLFSMSSVSFADTTDEAISINFATIASNPNAEVKMGRMLKLHMLIQTNMVAYLRYQILQG